MADEEKAQDTQKSTKKSNGALIGIVIGAVVLVLAIIIIVLVSGGKSESIVGSWKYDGYLDYTYEFKEDGTCTYSIMTCTYRVDGKNVEILYDGQTEALKGTFEGGKLDVIDSLGNDVYYNKQ